ncbi:MAG: dNTP triphosphohydrolase [Planctomycetes bacterium]|nr:dNTP triphosphohydrolase [Planctomycetota bacterium]
MTWLRREDLEDRELRELGRYAALSRDATRRLAEPRDPLRTTFQRDRDRVIHSTAFRRLQHKTQVVAAYEGDHYRSRMTHSLEVSQLARSVACSLRLNTDLAEAIALAHDLGHPPFGHVGEEALNELMTDHGGFRHNAQGARVVDLLEDRYGHGHGLNLTDATRRSLLKGKVPDGFPIAPDLAARRAAPVPVEAAVVDHCDRIAYLCHDLDDGLRARVFSLDEVAELRLWQRARAWRPDAGSAATISAMISLLVRDLVEATVRRWDEHPDATASVAHGDDMIVDSQDLLAFLRARFYRSRRVLAVMERGQERIRAAFGFYVANPAELPDGARARIAEEGLRRTVCDHVAGMTDRYLLRVVEGLPDGSGPATL